MVHYRHYLHSNPHFRMIRHHLFEHFPFDKNRWQICCNHFSIYQNSFQYVLHHHPLVRMIDLHLHPLQFCYYPNYTNYQLVILGNLRANARKFHLDQVPKFKTIQKLRDFILAHLQNRTSYSSNK